MRKTASMEAAHTPAPGDVFPHWKYVAGLIAVLEAGFCVLGDPQREAVPGGGFSYVSIVLGT
ncbi:hypothetical protein [Actinobaculum sp. 352]|uniref:hypothetical protein n=1 Tax=Actinobaculum sp. 352 TaxID=2490946 RepID=UPI000FBF4AFC|nr:hypothetical protein [Actinobaculum sp. 352]RTE49860.1 hypothetical protein EKN07_04880 [Actinobaculum sp. 352]